MKAYVCSNCVSRRLSTPAIGAAGVAWCLMSWLTGWISKTNMNDHSSIGEKQLCNQMASLSESGKKYLERVEQLLEQLNTYSAKVNALTKERSILRDQVFSILLSLQKQRPLHDQSDESTTSDYKKESSELKQLWEEMKFAQKKHITSMGDLQEIMRLVELAEKRYQVEGSTGHPERESIIEMVASLGEMYFVCLGQQQKSFARCRQLESVIVEQGQILGKPQAGTASLSMCSGEQQSDAMLLEKAELRLNAIEVEITESRRIYRKTMRALEEVSEEMHQARLMAQVEAKRALLAASAAVSLLALHNRLHHRNHHLLVLLCSLRQAEDS